MRIKLLLVFILISASILLIRVNAQEETIRIVWREDVDQYYTYDKYSMLASDLVENNMNVSSYNASEIFGNATEVPSADIFGPPESTIIVIPNPPQEFYSYELEFLKNFVDSGGGLIIMGDIQYGDRHYGKPEYLNDLLDHLGAIDKVKYWGTNDNGDEIKDDTNNYGRSWQVIVSKEYFKPHKISAGIEQVVINSQSLVVSDPNIIVATSPSTSYAEDTTNTKHASGEIPWLAALELGEGKIVVCGSSKMFSDTQIYGTSTPYIKAEDNEQLFFNMIWWITGKRIVAQKPIELIKILDIFPIISGFIAGIFLRREGRIDYKQFGISATIASLLYSMSAVIQVAVFGQVIVGTALPDWGAIIKGGGEIPAELNAFVRYLFAGFCFVFVGLVILIIVEKIDEYLALGIMNRLGVKKVEAS